MKNTAENWRVEEERVQRSIKEATYWRLFPRN